MATKKLVKKHFTITFEDYEKATNHFATQNAIRRYKKRTAKTQGAHPLTMANMKPRKVNFWH